MTTATFLALFFLGLDTLLSAMIAMGAHTRASRLETRLDAIESRD